MASREVTRYTVWEEFPECYIEEVSVTDAAPGVSLVLAEEYDRLRKALQKISKAEGAYSMDPLTHASNCIDQMIDTAITALQEAGDE